MVNPNMKPKIVTLLIVPLLLAPALSACSPAPTPTPAPTTAPTVMPAPSAVPTQVPATLAPTATQVTLDPATWGMQEIDAPAFSPSKGSIHYSLPESVAQAFIAKVMDIHHLIYDPGQTDSRTDSGVYNQVFALLYPGSPAEKDWREHVDTALQDTTYTFNNEAPIRDSNYFTDWMAWAVDGGRDLGLLVMVHFIVQPQTITYYDQDGNVVKQNTRVKPVRVVDIYQRAPDGQWLNSDETANVIEP